MSSGHWKGGRGREGQLIATVIRSTDNTHSADSSIRTEFRVCRSFGLMK